MCGYAQRPGAHTSHSGEIALSGSCRGLRSTLVAAAVLFSHDVALSARICTTWGVLAPLSSAIIFRFYKKLGFHEIGRADDDVWLGMRFQTETPRQAFSTGVIEGNGVSTDFLRETDQLLPHSHTHITSLLNIHTTLTPIKPMQYVFSIWHGTKARAKRASKAASMAGDVRISPEQGKACELAGVTRARQAMPFSAHIHTRTY